MARIKLISDGSIDVPQSEVDEYDITVVPPIVHLEGTDYRSGVDITPAEFMHRIRTAKALATTSQPSPGQFAEAFEAALASHDEILYVGISSALSGTINSARQAANLFPDAKITMVDTYSLSAGAGMQVVAAARALAGGATVDEAVAATKRAKADTTLYFAVKDLTFLIKGGRVGRAAGAIGQFLNVCPIMTVDPEDGAFSPLTRVRTFKKTVNTMLANAEGLIGKGGAGRFVVLRGDLDDEANKLTDEIHRRFDVRWFRDVVPAPTLLAHTGPDALGLVVSRGDWP
ncbi:MAG: DegV family protein [Anaerolineales bacterium]|nr:DegV family protein [Anaerolineales bacterium]MCB9128612.1 DegV family protein [Ardenticatenales bacterium]MCB9172550.1 DegV family protein [Ardenticatenales bacterium]